MIYDVGSTLPNKSLDDLLAKVKPGDVIRMANGERSVTTKPFKMLDNLTIQLIKPGGTRHSIDFQWPGPASAGAVHFPRGVTHAKLLGVDILTARGCPCVNYSGHDCEIRDVANLGGGW